MGPEIDVEKIEEEQILNIDLKEVDKEKVLILNFGGQYTQLIGRAVRKQNIYAEIKPYDIPYDYIVEGDYDAIILGGGPHSAYAEDAPSPDKRILDLGIPIFGICYGAQWIVQNTGGKVGPSEKGEYGKTEIHFQPTIPFFTNLVRTTTVWMTHSDEIYEVGPDYEVKAYSENGPIAVFAHKEKPISGVQFHPEVDLTDEGIDMFKATLHDDLELGDEWHYEYLIERTIDDIRERVGDRKMIFAYSGGVSSMTLAMLANRALDREQIQYVYVDTGMQRWNENAIAQGSFHDTIGGELVTVDASERFFKALEGIEESEDKRYAVGHEFIQVFEEEAEKFGAEVLMMGTTFPSVVESGIGGAEVKPHHNVGALPKETDFVDIHHPFHELFKDEIRLIANELDCSQKVIWQKPFPGVGLAIRVMGEVTPEKVKLVQDADRIFDEELDKADYKRKTSQYFTVLSDKTFIGSKGDVKTHEYALILRAVNTHDFLTAESSELPLTLLKKISTRIVNEVGQINRVVYEITGKPSGTIEWE